MTKEEELTRLADEFIGEAFVMLGDVPWLEPSDRSQVRAILTGVGDLMSRERAALAIIQPPTDRFTIRYWRTHCSAPAASPPGSSARSRPANRSVAPSRSTTGRRSA